MKRTPLKRRTPLRASSGLKRENMPRKRRRSRPDKDDRAYLAWIRTLPCSAPGCAAKPPSDAHHRTGAGMGARAHDRATMPLCRPCHGAIDEFRGVFIGWTRERRAAWQDAQIANLNARYEHEAA